MGLEHTKVANTLWSYSRLSKGAVKTKGETSIMRGLAETHKRKQLDKRITKNGRKKGRRKEHGQSGRDGESEEDVFDSSEA